MESGNSVYEMLFPNAEAKEKSCISQGVSGLRLKTDSVDDSCRKNESSSVTEFGRQP